MTGLQIYTRSCDRRR